MVLMSDARGNSLTSGVKRPLFYQANEANLDGFWLTGFFEADGCVTICQTTCACRMIFSQSDRYLLDLIGKEFNIRVRKRLRKDKIKPTIEYTAETNRCDTLKVLFDYFHRYPLQGIKHGHMFLTEQALVVKLRYFSLRNSFMLQASQIQTIYFKALFVCRYNLVLIPVNFSSKASTELVYAGQ